MHVYCVCMCVCAYMCMRIICMCRLGGEDKETHTIAQQVGAVEVSSVLCRGWEDPRKGITACRVGNGVGWVGIVTPAPLNYPEALPLLHHLAQPLPMHLLVAGPRYPCQLCPLKCGTPELQRDTTVRDMGPRAWVTRSPVSQL